MVKMKSVVVLCDVPGDDHEGEVEEWFFTAPGRPRCPIDLCEKHAAPLYEIFQHAPQGNGNGGPQVKTMEQVEKEKAAAKKAATRRARKKP